MSDIYDRIKEVLPIKETIQSITGLRMKGPHLEQCPFCGHHDCFSFKDDGFRCFSCDTKGDICNFLERYESLTQKEALERVSNHAGISLPSPRGKGARSEGDYAKKTTEPPSVKDKIFTATADYYYSRRREGRSYFIEARKHAERTIGALRAGWSDGKLLDHLMGLGFTDGDILASGLVIERQGGLVLA